MSDAVYQRIARVFPMLSASNDGEVTNAARAITKILKEANLGWTDLAVRIRDGAPERPPSNPFTGRPGPGPNPFTKSKPPEDGPRRKPSAWSEDKKDVEGAYGYRGQLDDWSHEFMESIHDQVIHQGRRLTEKQRDKLNEILDKLGL